MSLNYCIPEEYTVLEAMAKIEQSRERTVFVINKENKVVGVLSQGDILKAILAGMNLHAKVDRIYSKSFLYLKNKDMNKAINYIKSKNISLVPIINENFEIIEFITIVDIINYLEDK